MKLSPISLAVLPLLTVFTANAAVYQIVELDTTNKVRSTSGVAATIQGDVVSNGATFLDFELDISAIDFDSDAMVALLTEEELADAKNGNINLTVKTKIVNYLINNPSLRNQPVGSVRVLKQPSNGLNQQVVFRDIANTKNNDEFAYAANDLGQITGIATAPSTKGTFTVTLVPGEDDEEPEIPVIPQPFTVWVPEPGYMLGYVVDSNNRVVLPPAFNELGGGMSAGQGINNNGQVVGFTSAGVTDSVKEAVETLCDGNSLPVQQCLNSSMALRGISLNSLLNQVRNYQTVDTVPDGYFERAALWQLTDENSALLTKTWGFLGNKGTGAVAPTSEDYDVPSYYSRANAINADGIAVGHSLYTDADRIITFYDSIGFEYRRIYAAPHATIYNGYEVTGFINPDEWLASVAIDVNNQDIVTGYALQNINSVIRNRFFTYNMNTGTLKFPTGFFNSSSSEPRDINNSGKVVGRAEVILSGTVSRRYHAFIYDNATDTFQDLNSLVGCDAPTLVDATSINDNGEVLAVALINRPVLDINGNEQLGTDGTVIKADQATQVKLRPIANGQPENCNPEAGQYERKGGGFSALWLLLLGALPVIRRRKG